MRELINTITSQSAGISVKLSILAISRSSRATATTCVMWVFSILFFNARQVIKHTQVCKYPDKTLRRKQNLSSEERVATLSHSRSFDADKQEDDDRNSCPAPQKPPLSHRNAGQTANGGSKRANDGPAGPSSKKTKLEPMPRALSEQHTSQCSSSAQSSSDTL